MDFTQTSKIIDHICKYDSYLDIKGKLYIPSLQRDLDESRIPQMVSHIYQAFEMRAAPIFGAVTLCNLDNRLYVIDGQHRLKALEKHHELTGKLVPFYAVIYTITDPDMMKFIFSKINAGVPLPNYISNPGQDDDRKTLLRNIEAKIKNLPLFKTTSTRQYRPYINVTFFMNQLEHSYLIESVETCDHFLQILGDANQKLQAKCHDASYISVNKITPAMIKKCEKSGIYIGIDQNMLWFDTLYDLPNHPRLNLPSS